MKCDFKFCPGDILQCGASIILVRYCIIGEGENEYAHADFGGQRSSTDAERIERDYTKIGSTKEPPKLPEAAP